jgi:hypothetical protein
VCGGTNLAADPRFLLGSDQTQGWPSSSHRTHDRLPSRLEHRVLRDRHESQALLVREKARRESQPSSLCVVETVIVRETLEGVAAVGCVRR